MRTPSSDSNTALSRHRERGSLPWQTLLLLLFFLTGTLGCLVGLLHLRQPLAVETFVVGETPVEGVKLADLETPPVHFLLLHGYGANRGQLRHLATVLAVSGAAVYLVDLPGRGDHTGTVSPRSPASLDPTLPTPKENQAVLGVVRHLEQHSGVRRERLVVVGHSLGGGVGLDVARQVQPLATISLAGLERPVAPRRPQNLLLLTANLEIPALRQAADRMHETAHSGSGAGRGEFPATHSSLPFHSPVQHAIVDWTNQALPQAGLAIPPYFNERLLALELGGLLFLGGLFVPLAGLGGTILVREPFAEVVPESRLSLWSPIHVAAYGGAAGASAVAALELLRWREWPYPLGFLGLDGGDYLASVLVLATVWLLPLLLRGHWVRSWRETLARVLASMVLAASVIVFGGGFISWSLFDLWPTPARLVKMLLLALCLLPYALGEELLARSFAERRGASPFTAFLAWRVGLLAAIFVGSWGFASGDTIVGLLALPLLLLSMAEYFFSDTLHRALGSVYGTSVFKALLIGWIIATIFPLR